MKTSRTKAKTNKSRGPERLYRVTWTGGKGSWASGTQYYALEDFALMRYHAAQDQGASAHLELTECNWKILKD